MVPSLRYAARSDVGMVRQDNEDSGYAGSRLLVVADGMGGHASGELASSAAVATFADFDRDVDLADAADVLGLLAAAVDEAHEQIGRAASGSPESRGMGTTVTAFVWLGDRAALAHVGDSRAYLVRDGALVQLTKDHTYVQSLVDAGRITPEEALVHHRRNLLTKALDGNNPVEGDLSIREARVGDRYLLCTDGLHGVVPESVMASILTGGTDPTGAVDALVEQALAGGAPDNVTALVADVVDVPEADAEMERTPIVVGAAAEPRNRARLPGLAFPADSQPGSPDTWRPAPSSAESPQPATTRTSPNRRHRRPGFIGALMAVAVCLIALGLLAAWWWTRTQYYVGSDNGLVAVFQGVPQGWGPHGLSTVENVSDTRVADLPEFERAQVEANIPATGATDALRILGALKAAAASCAAIPAPAGCPGAVAAVPSAPASPAATASAPASPPAAATTTGAGR